MAEFVARSWAERGGVDAVFTSAGVSAEESGNTLDHRAAQVLRAAGYPSSGHRAHRITADEIGKADLLIAMEELHRARLHRLVPGASVALLTDFDPDAVPGSAVDDPWYGDSRDFQETLRALEAAMPGVLDAVRTLDRS